MYIYFYVTHSYFNSNSNPDIINFTDFSYDSIIKGANPSYMGGGIVEQI